jgi:glycosyltransferase involved in cell wall biosynthesis
MTLPLVSVLLPVYNGEAYMKEAVESILNQSYKNFELLIINDGSTDNSVEIIESYKDVRIRLVHNETNLKLIATLNKGLALARGEYLARMDCDDVSLPERLSKQVAFMHEHPEIGICGTWSKTFGAVKKSWRTCFPVRHIDIVAHLVFNTAISHPTAMFDMKRFRTLNLKYDTAALHAEDYDLWVNASGHFDLGNVPEVLFLYRVHPEQTSQTVALLQKSTTVSVRKKMLGIIGVPASDEELALHSSISDYSWEKSSVFYAACKDWLQKIDRMVAPPYDRAVRGECLKRLIELHKYVFGYRGVLDRAYLSRISHASVEQ